MFISNIEPLYLGLLNKIETFYATSADFDMTSTVGAKCSIKRMSVEMV